MRSSNYFVLFQFLIFCEQYSFLYTKAILGVNIRNANEHEFPTTASIISRKKRKHDPSHNHICTAVLVTKKNAISAEHCMIKNVTNCRLMVGSLELNSGHEYEIKDWISYAQWCKKTNFVALDADNDISILTLTNSINIPNFVPAILSNKPPNKLYGSNAIIAGWGTNNEGIISLTMQTTIVRIIMRRECMKRINELAKAKSYVPESLICSIGEPWALLAPGESGGPLFDMNNTLIGINVATCPKTQNEINTNEVNLHASIKFYRHFIDDVVFRN